MSEVLCYKFFKYTVLRRELFKINAPQIPAKRHRLYIRYLFLTMKSLVQANWPRAKTQQAKVPALNSSGTAVVNRWCAAARATQSNKVPFFDMLSSDLTSFDYMKHTYSIANFISLGVAACICNPATWRRNSRTA